MANISKDQLVAHLNALKLGGATEKQLKQAIVAAGYKSKEFITDLSGNFVLSANDIKTYDGSDQLTQVGGESKTVYILPAQKTTTSQQYNDEAKFTLKEAALFKINPNSSFGQKQLAQKLASGEISHEFVNYLINSSPVERETQYNLIMSKHGTLVETTRENTVKQESQTVLSNPTSYASLPTSYIQTRSIADTTVSGAIAEGGIQQVNIDGVSYQVKATATGIEYTNEQSGETFIDSVTASSHSTVLFGTGFVTGRSTVSRPKPPVKAPEQVTEEPFGYTADGVSLGQFGSLSEPTSVAQEPTPMPTVDPMGNVISGPPTVLDETATIMPSSASFDSTKLTNPQIVNQEPGTNTTVEATPTESISAGTIGETSASANPPSTTGTKDAQKSSPTENLVPFPANPDYRVRISLSSTANYLYKVGKTEAGILAPLQETNGVIFPYTPTISVAYNANYDSSDLVHSNYKIYNYRNSSVESIQITGTFTAQDTYEANYMLAVIHFFRSATKMFYGKDIDPIKGMPPPLVYLSGLGEYGFDNHPMLINSFNLTYPDEVDYIRAHPAGLNNRLLPTYQSPVVKQNISGLRMKISKLLPGGKKLIDKVLNQDSITSSPSGGDSGTSYTMMPSKIQLTVNCLPVVTRDNISNNFSLKDYASGKLLQGSKNNITGGGIW